MALHLEMLQRHGQERLERAKPLPVSSLMPEDAEAILNWLQANAGSMVRASTLHDVPFAL